MENKKQEKFLFRAIDPYTVTNIVDNEESDSKKGFILWGSSNNYPQYLNTLYKEVSTLHSIVEGCVDYICGDEITVDDAFWNARVNDKDETIEDLVKSISRDFVKYGGFAINVVRNRAGGVGSLYYIPLEDLRSDEKNTKFYYSKEWGKSSTGRVKYTIYPRFDPLEKDINSIFFYSNNKTDTYPNPLWSAAVKACETEKSVSDYHLNAIKNGFSASYLISFNNGVPNEEQADEIEEDILEKFSGENNAGRIAINFANDRDHSCELSKLESDDASERYQTLIKRCSQELFTSFRANPNLFAIPTENNGFNQEEFESSFKIFNRTTIRPMQKVIARALNYIIEKEITIKPFSMEEDNEKSISENNQF